MTRLTVVEMLLRAGCDPCSRDRVRSARLAHGDEHGGCGEVGVGAERCAEGPEAARLKALGRGRFRDPLPLNAQEGRTVIHRIVSAATPLAILDTILEACPQVVFERDRVRRPQSSEVLRSRPPSPASLATSVTPPPLKPLLRSRAAPCWSPSRRARGPSTSASPTPQPPPSPAASHPRAASLHRAASAAAPAPVERASALAAVAVAARPGAAVVQAGRVGARAAVVGAQGRTRPRPPRGRGHHRLWSRPCPNRRRRASGTWTGSSPSSPS